VAALQVMEKKALIMVTQVGKVGKNKLLAKKIGGAKVRKNTK
jgi:hypothetical protein